MSAIAEQIQRSLAPVPTALYRHFDADGKLLYVGISLSAVHRLGQHREHSYWYKRISRVHIEWLDSREAAIEAERLAIQSEDPECNTRHKPRPEDKAATRADDSRRELTRQVARFKPVYGLSEVASMLGYGSSSKVRSLIAEKALGSVVVGSKTLVTGWQLIDFLESIGGIPK